MTQYTLQRAEISRSSLGYEGRWSPSEQNGTEWEEAGAWQAPPIHDYPANMAISDWGQVLWSPGLSICACVHASVHTCVFLPSKSQSFITAESTQSFRHILLWNIGLEKSTKCQQSDVYRYSILLIYTCDQLNRLIGKCIFRPIYSKNDCNIHRLLIHDKLESIWPSLGYANCSKQAKSTIQHTIVPLDRSTFKEYQFIRSIHYRSGTETQSLIYTIAKKI